MANKDFTLDDGLSLTVYKLRSSRNLRLSIGPGGKVRVSIPAWAPYRVGVHFAANRRAWITSQQPVLQLLQPNQVIGKAHHLQFESQPGAHKPTSRIAATAIIVRYPPDLDPANLAVQQVAQEACIRALRKQAEQLLPQRLACLATEHNFTYSDVSIKRLKGRWGSCDSQRHITLNLFLMQLPWELIDYVLLHELTHTVILRHGPDFWKNLGAVLPDFARRKKSMSAYHPVLAGVA